MANRKIPLINNEIYHVFTRSISEFMIFRSDNDYKRMTDAMYYYLAEKRPYSFSNYTKLLTSSKDITLEKVDASKKIVQILGYCLMPTHIHLIIKQISEGGISKYVNLILKSYGKYFNIKYNRLGPLCEGRFKNVPVETNEQFLHLTRYVHLNPTSIGLVKEPDEWKNSSYKEYIGLISDEDKICEFSDYLDMKPEKYKEFVEERKEYQKELKLLKGLTLE